MPLLINGNYDYEEITKSKILVVLRVLNDQIYILISTSRCLSIQEVLVKNLEAEERDDADKSHCDE